MGKFVLNIVIGLSALFAIYFQYIDNAKFYTVFKPLTTILIILVPIIYGKREVKKYFYSVVLALSFCLIGDIFLLYDGYFIYGLGSFLLAHIFFSYSFISLGGLKHFKFPLIILLCVGFVFYTFISSGLGNLSTVVIVYILFIIFMCWQGICLYMWKKKKVFLSIGIAAILFFISDSLIAIDKFKYPFKLSGILVLSTYWVSISMLANSTLYIQKPKL